MIETYVAVKEEMAIKQLKEPVIVVTEISIQPKEAKRLNQWLYDVIKIDSKLRNQKAEK